MVSCPTVFVSVASSSQLYMPSSSCAHDVLSFFCAMFWPFLLRRTSACEMVKPVSAVLPSLSSKNGPTSTSTAVDCFKNRIALEIEWNNKDPFFDRDLNNFRLLFDLRAISVGVIITRTDELQDIFKGLGRGKSYGASTTHMSKLLPRIQGGGGAGCPLLIFGIRKELYVEDC